MSSFLYTLSLLKTPPDYVSLLDICLPSSQQNSPKLWTAAILSSFCLNFPIIFHILIWGVVEQESKRFLVYLFKFRTDFPTVLKCWGAKGKGPEEHTGTRSEALQKLLLSFDST